MIWLEGVSKSFRCGRVEKPVLRNASLRLERRQTVALLGRNGAGKTTFLRLLAGVLAPDHGRITRDGSVSWPVAHAGGLHGDMTGLSNIRFVARLYGRDTKHMIHYCREMSELGDDLGKPVRSFSSGMRARLAFAMSMAVPFDFYLIDEVISVGDAAFRSKAEHVLTERLSRTGGLVVSHSPAVLKRLCQSALVLENGALIHFASVDQAIAHHQAQLCPS